MRSAINWIQPIIFILGIHYQVVHDVISYACKFVLSVLVVFIYFILTGTLDIMIQDLLPLLFILIGSQDIMSQYLFSYREIMFHFIIFWFCRLTAD